MQEASERKVQSGDRVGFDTDMVGPYGYCADLFTVFHCGPAKPTARQKELYRLCAGEVEFNLGLIKAGVSFPVFNKMSTRSQKSFVNSRTHA